jgi:tellurite resistance protein TerC
VIRLARKIIPVHPDDHGGRFFVRLNKKTYATTMFITLIMIEFTDLVFAVDSIPAVLAISKDPFIVYTSNVFAILGLRSLYFALSSLITYFRFLKYGVSAILVFVGIKMVLPAVLDYHMSTELSLLVLVGLLGTSILASLILPKKVDEEQNPTH